MIDYENYLKYPNLVKDLIQFFSSLKKINEKSSAFRTVIDYCSQSPLKNALDPDDTTMIQPKLVNDICEILCKENLLSKKSTQSIDGYQNGYFCSIKDKDVFEKIWPYNEIMYNTLVYGFPYLYNKVKDHVLPVVFYHPDGKQELGTCFHFCNGIATCKHCLNKAAHISIKGYSGDFLNSKPILISDNDDVDLAFIPETNNFPYVFHEDGNVMDEIAVLGYPRLPAFNNFLNIEKAHVSCVGRRIVATHGNISSVEKNYLSKMELLLITARVRGGNSGGPVFNRKGYLVGISCETLGFEGKYDDMGYGMAAKSSDLMEIIRGNNVKEMEKANDFFVDFE